MTDTGHDDAPAEPAAADGFLAALMGDILEAARHADTLTRQPNENGDFMEFALLPDRLLLDLPVSCSDAGRLGLPARGHPATGTLEIRWRRLQTPEAVRAEIDDTNEIDGLIRQHDRQRNLDARYRSGIDNPPPEEDPEHDHDPRGTPGTGT